MRLLSSRRRAGVLAGGTLAAALAVSFVLAPTAALATSTINLGALNCGSTLILSSAYGNGSHTHTHFQGTTYRAQGFPGSSGVYGWTYYNSGFTSVTSVRLYSSDSFSDTSRSCDF